MTDEQMEQMRRLYPNATDEQLEHSRAIVEQLVEIVTPAWESLKALVAAMVPVVRALLNYDTKMKRLEECPNRRVVYLAKHARKARTRKKNLHRAIKILKKEDAV